MPWTFYIHIAATDYKFYLTTKNIRQLFESEMLLLKSGKQ